MVSRNPKLVLDDSLRQRVTEVIDELDSFKSEWVLASAGGLGLLQERYCSLYSSEQPFLMLTRVVRPIIDTMLDLYILDAAFAREHLAAGAISRGHFFELGIILSGYEAGRLSLFMPKLAAGVDGPFRTRDYDGMSREANACLRDLSCRTKIETLSGPIMVEAASAADTVTHLPSQDRPSPFARRDLNAAIERTRDRHLPVLSISIVTRTRFGRPHLLRRLLTSITRALTESADVEVVLSTDVARDQAEAGFADVRSDFPALSLTLAVNKNLRHSRVENMLGGIRAASREYIWIVDDDDYVDIFAFQFLRRTLFGSDRPLIVAESQVHKEAWDLSSESFPVLKSSEPDLHWRAHGWRHLFTGVNQLPICNVIAPRVFLTRCIDSFDFRYDLSEDYALFLLLLTSPSLPSIVELNKVVAHISIRESGENSVTLKDRSGWTRDIAGYLFDLMHGSGQKGVGAWSVLATGPGAGHFDGLIARRHEQPLQQEIAARDRQIATLTQQLSALQRLIERESKAS